MGKLKQTLGVFRPAKAAVGAVMGGIVLAASYVQTVQGIVTSVLRLPVGVIQALAVLVILAMIAVMFYQNQRPRKTYNGESLDETATPAIEKPSDDRVVGVDEHGDIKVHENVRAALEAKIQFLETRIRKLQERNGDPEDPSSGLRASQYREKLANLEEKARFLEMSWKAAQKAQADLRQQLETAQTAFAQEREAHRQTKQESESRWYWIRYDIRERRTFPELTPVALEVAHNEMKRIRDVMAAAGRGALDLLVQIGEPMNVGSDEKNKLLASLVSQHRFAPAGHLYERLFEELGAPGVDQRVDYREWLIHWYEAYNELRRTIVQLADFAGVKLTDLLGYGEWRKQDRQFLEKVADIGVMHDAIKAVNRHRRYPLPMPD